MNTSPLKVDAPRKSRSLGNSSEEIVCQQGARKLRPLQTRFVLRINPHFILLSMLMCSIILAIIGTISAYIIYIVEIKDFRILARIFLLDTEGNLPTMFSFGLLVLCSLLLAVISAQESVSSPRRRLHWIFLAGLFFVMAFDEAASLHERLIPHVREALNATGLFYFAWVIPAWIFVIALSLIYLRFLLTLPSPFMRLFILSGALYVGGALGVEMPGGAYAEVHGTRNFTFQIMASVEETLEMVGLSVFAYTLARFLGHERDSICLRFRAP